MADLSLFQSLVSSCATILPRLKKEQQEEATILFKKMLASPKEENHEKAENSEKVEAAEIKAESKMSRWWRKRKSIEVFEDNAEETKRQRGERKTSRENPKETRKENGENIEEDSQEDGARSPLENKVENTEEGAAEKKADRDASIAEILMLREKLKKPGKKASLKTSRSIETVIRPGNLVETLKNTRKSNVEEKLLLDADEKNPGDDVAEALPKLKTSMVELELDDEIGVDLETLKRLDRFEEDIEEEEELKRSLEAEDLEEDFEEAPLKKQINKGKNKEEKKVEFHQKQIKNKAKGKVGRRPQKRTGKGE